MIKINISKIIHYLLIYVLLCYTGSMAFREYNDYFIVGTIIISIFFLVRNYRKIEKNYIIFIIGLIFIFLFEILITNMGVYISSITSIIARFLIIMVCIYYNKGKFPQRLIKAIVFLAVISLIGYTISMINPNFLKGILSHKIEVVKTYWSTYSINYYGKLLFVFQDGLGKNLGIYHEPGLYQMVLNAALYCLLFRPQLLNLKIYQINSYIIIIIITLITCQSTTGFIGMALILTIYFIYNNRNSDKKIIINLIIIIIFLVVSISIFQGKENIIYRNIIGKIINNNGEIDFGVSTGKSRIVSMKSDIEIMKQYPLGIGYRDYNMVWKNNLIDNTISDVSSCVGVTQTAAILGIHTLIYILIFYLLACKKNITQIVPKIAYWAVFLNTTFAQPQIWYPILIVILFIPKNIENGREEI